MRNIVLISFGDLSGSYDWTSCTKPSTVENLHFESCFLLDKSIAGLIRCCEKLKSLSFWWDSDAIDVYGGTPLPAIDTSTILTALRSHRKSLEILVLTNSQGTSYVSSYPTHELSFLTALSELDVDDNFLLEGGNWDSLKLPPHLRVLAVYMETPFIGFFQVFRAIGQTAQRDLSDVTITIPFGGNESHTDPFVGVWEVAGTDEPGKHVMTVQIDMNKEGSPWFYHLWTEDVSYSMRMRFLGEGMGQLMDFCAEQVVIHGVDFLINTKDYLPHSQSSHTAG